MKKTVMLTPEQCWASELLHLSAASHFSDMARSAIRSDVDPQKEKYLLNLALEHIAIADAIEAAK